MSILLLHFAPDDLSAEQIAAVKAQLPAMRVVVTNDPAQIDTIAHDVTIVAGHVPPQLIECLPHVRWVQLWSAGADWLLRYPQLVERPFVLTNASGVHAVPISEHIMAMLLMFARSMQHAVRAQAKHEWWRAGRAGTFELAEKTMLILGIGAIGARTAMLAAAHGMRVEAVRRDPSVATEHVTLTVGAEQLKERLPHADVVVVTLPLTNDTRALIGAEELRAMRPTAYIINIGRGGTIDEQALIQALHEGWIAGAGLDVFEHEPLPRDSPLWDMPNVIITGHYAGNTAYYDQRALAIFHDNLRRFLAGEAMKNVVDKQAGY